MANNGVVVFAPLNTDDLVTVLGCNSHDVATLCSYTNINKFALYKPFRCNPDHPYEVTTAERKAQTYGISLGYIASATSAAVNLVANLQTVMPTTPKWTYLPPRPGTDWCRMTDFINENSPTGPGYNRNAKPPMSGFRDITLFKSEFGSESKVYSFNFKWGSASHQGANDTSGIEIPITELHPTITNGTWRFGLLIFFPNGEKLQVAVASSPSAIQDNLSQPGDMMIRPAGTAQLKELFTTAFNSGIREINAIPFLGNDLSRSGYGNSDSWKVQASTQLISMPLGEKIKINLSDRFSNVSIALNSITIKYLDRAGNAKATYVLTPTDASSGQHQTQLAAPSNSNSVRCQIEADFTISGTMASGDSVAKGGIFIGLEQTLVNTFVSTLERHNGTSFAAIGSITTLGGRYRMIATDAQDSTSDDRSAVMNYIENLPRRSTYATDLAIHLGLSLDGAIFNSSNYFIHHG